MIVIRRFRQGDELALFDVFFSVIHEVAVHDYTQAQIQASGYIDHFFVAGAYPRQGIVIPNALMYKSLEP